MMMIDDVSWCDFENEDFVRFRGEFQILNGIARPRSTRVRF